MHWDKLCIIENDHDESCISAAGKNKSKVEGIKPPTRDDISYSQPVDSLSSSNIQNSLTHCRTEKSNTKELKLPYSASFWHVKMWWEFINIFSDNNLW